VRLWKWLGVAGLAGVAATGAILVRDERARRAYTPAEVRTRLHERAAQLAAEAPPIADLGRLPVFREKFRGLWGRLSR